MKILKRPHSRWSMKVTCTGEGNSGAGCHAVLLLESGDLFITRRVWMDEDPVILRPDRDGIFRPDRSGEVDTFFTFSCPCCTALTDVQIAQGEVRSARIHPDETEWLRSPDFNRWKEARTSYLAAKEIEKQDREGSHAR